MGVRYVRVGSPPVSHAPRGARFVPRGVISLRGPSEPESRGAAGLVARVECEPGHNACGVLVSPGWELHLLRICLRDEALNLFGCDEFCDRGRPGAGELLWKRESERSSRRATWWLVYTMSLSGGSRPSARPPEPRTWKGRAPGSGSTSSGVSHHGAGQLRPPRGVVDSQPGRSP